MTQPTSLPRPRRQNRGKWRFALILAAILATISHSQAGESAASAKGKPYPITLETALRLADERNSEIAIQLERQKQSVLARNAAMLEWLPTVRAGGSYARQDGALQETDGNVENISRDARYGGLGVGGIGSGPPQIAGTSLEIDFAEAIFKPLAAKQLEIATEAASEANRARVLLQVAATYYDLVKQHQAVGIAREAKAEADKLAKVTSNFADSGEGLVADAERAAVESLLLAEEIETARGDMAMASARLARLLRLDDATRLEPADGVILPIKVIDCEEGGEAKCIAQAIARRPELRENSALVEAARAAMKEQRYSAFIPKLGAYYNYGDFEGGGSPVRNGDRHDVGVAVYWQLNGMGLLNRNERKRRESELRQSEHRRDQTVSDIIAEVRGAHAALLSAQRRMTITVTAVKRAKKAHELNRERIFQNEGLPLESLQAMQSMARAEALNLRAVTDHNLAQLQLLVATGGEIGAKAAK